MTTQELPAHLLQEFYDLLALSSLETSLQMNLIMQIESGALEETAFIEILQLLREEARLDQDVERYSQEILNFDHDEYLNKVQQIVDTEVKKHLDSKQNSEFRIQNATASKPSFKIQHPASRIQNQNA